MARESKTRYALLGLLAFHPMSGYDIKQAIEQSLNYFWSESYGQIYPMLNGLADDRLAVKTVERQQGKPNRHVYAITDAGRAALAAWLEKPAEPHRERVEVLLKVFFGGMMPKETTVRHLEHFRREHTELLATYQVIEASLQARCTEHPNMTCGLFTVRCGIHVSLAMIAWCDETLAAMDVGNHD